MKRHLKRLAAPASWNIKRKSTKFIARPFPSGHPLNMCISLNLLLTEMAGYAKTTKEVKAIMQNDISVNGRKRTDHRSPVGFLDVIEIQKINEALRIILDKNGKIAYIKIPEKEAAIKVCKIIGKTMMHGKKLQLNLNDGQNFTITNEKYNVGDSVVVDFKKNAIIEHLPFEKNMTVFLTEGKQKGSIGKIVEMDAETVTIKLQTGNEYKTKKSATFVVGKEHPAVTVQGH
ncbi:MAG: 30S ribosomal protein S4e [Syntrophales bacterium]